MFCMLQTSITHAHVCKRICSQQNHLHIFKFTWMALANWLWSEKKSVVLGIWRLHSWFFSRRDTVSVQAGWLLPVWLTHLRSFAQNKWSDSAYARRLERAFWLVKLEYDITSIRLGSYQTSFFTWQTSSRSIIYILIYQTNDLELWFL